MLKQLSGLCGDGEEQEVVIEAGKVVGNISSYNWSVLYEGEGATRGEEGDGEEDEVAGSGGEGMLAHLKLKVRPLTHVPRPPLFPPLTPPLADIEAARLLPPLRGLQDGPRGHDPGGQQ